MDFERIHPFADGNGRTGRMVLNQQLINEKLLPIIIESKGNYCQAFRRYDRSGDISQMMFLYFSNEEPPISFQSGNGLISFGSMLSAALSASEKLSYSVPRVFCSYSSNTRICYCCSALYATARPFASLFCSASCKSEIASDPDKRDSCPIDCNFHCPSSFTMVTSVEVCPVGAITLI